MSENGGKCRSVFHGAQGVVHKDIQFDGTEEEIKQKHSHLRRNAVFFFLSSHSINKKQFSINEIVDT